MREQMVAFDTYTHINELKKAGFKEEQAAVIIKSLMDSRATDISHLATKEQVFEVKSQLTEQISEVKSQLTEQISEVRSQLNTLEHRVTNIEKTMATKEDLKDVQINLIKWMFGTIIAFSGIILAGMKLILSGI